MKDKPLILVVDDRPQNIELVEAYLVPEGYEIVTAANGEEALEKLLGSQIDLMLLDVLMPGIDGFEVIRRVRRDAAHRLLPIVLLTSLRETDDRVKGIEAGCDDFISKPINKMELLARVRSLLKVKDYNDLVSDYRIKMESEVTRRTEELRRALESLQQESTDRKLAEEKEKISEDKYRSIVENIVEGVFQATPEGRYISANPALARMMGYDTPLELTERVTDISKQVYVNPEDRVTYRKTLEEKGIIQGFQTQGYRKNGSIIWVSINARVVRDPAGEVFYYEGTIEDITARKTADDTFKQNAERLRKTLLGTVNALSMTAETRDPYTSGHQRRVSCLARAIAQDMALPEDTVDNIRIAGLIHDIGKISVPAEILSKPGKLTDLEFSLIKVHSQSGYDILRDAELPYPIAEIILQHHERLNGSGHPQGLMNGHILLESRIVAVADVVEAMASHRPYRPALGIPAALEEIEKNKGTLYDAGVVDVCLKLFQEKGFAFE